MLKMELKFKDRILKHIDTDKSEITIGRGANNDIQIDNLAVSSNHAKLVKQSGSYRVEDLNSTNGTYLNDISIQKSNLSPDDIVTIGKHDLKIKSIDETEPVVEDLADKTIKVSG
jgi:pSer/pThr/pTyr-binding forkhead associated (FHA) protein